MRKGIWLGLLAVWLLPVVAEASIVVALPEPELIARADTIAFGVVVHTRSFVKQNGAVATRVELQVYEALRGVSVGDIITIEVPGGRLASGVVAVAAGAPTFKLGDAVFGFMVTVRNIRRPLGLSYGMLRARPDARLGYVLYRDLGDLILVNANGAGVDPATAAIAGVPLKEMTARVERRLVELGVPTAREVRP